MHIIQHGFYLHAAGPNSVLMLANQAVGDLLNDALANTFKKDKIDGRIIIVRK